MTTNRGSLTRPSKKAASYISKFAYHLNHTFPDIFAPEKPGHLIQNGPVFRTKKGIRNMNFHFA